MKGYWIMSNAFSAAIEMIVCILAVFDMVITLIDFQMLK